MENLLQGIPHVVVYINDIIITGRLDDEHLEILESVFSRLEKAGLRLKRGECFFMLSSISFLGYEVSAEGVHPLPEKVEAIQRAPVPTSISQFKSYLGLLEYYSRFVADLTLVVAPLYQLLKKN